MGTTRLAVTEQLERILGSSSFRTSKRSSTFLRFVVEQRLDNHAELLKERTLGVEVFGREPDYDTNHDPVVRTTAGEVRKRLAQYYQEHSHTGELRFELPPGSYIPEIHPAHPDSAGPVPPVIAETKAKSSGRLWGGLTLAAGLIAAMVFLLRPVNGQLDRFWQPMLTTSQDVLICIGQPKAYNFSSPVQLELDRLFGAQSLVPSDRSVPIVDVVPMWGRYVAFGDAKVISNLSALFGRQRKRFALRGEKSTTLADLRSGPAVLIGGFDNDWTLKLAGEQRFYFDTDFPNHAEIVRDRRNPKSDQWKVTNSWPKWDIPQDYAIVSRVLDPTTEKMVVVIAGITHFGTEAAGEFLTNPAYFEEAMRDAPSGWEHKSMQMVITAKVLSGSAGPPKLVARHFW